MDEPATPVSDRANSRFNPRRAGLLLVALLFVVVAAATWWILTRNHVSTDDAYARADSAQISCRVPGTVLRVQVENDNWADTGQVLAELDPADYRVAAERAVATLDSDEAEMKAAEVSLPPIDVNTSAQVTGADAGLNMARDNQREAVHNLEQLRKNRAALAADLSQAQRDFQRYENLFKSGAGTERQYEQARTLLNRTQAQAGAIDAQIAASESAVSAAIQQIDRADAQLTSSRSGRSNVEVQRHKIDALRAKRDKAKAELDAAQLILSYCRIPAPISGFIAQKSIQVGDRVQPGQALMAVVPLHEVYVEANFKETQLTNVRLGQPAEIKADIYPGYTYKGKVTGIRAGTGAAFSLIPAENATGNWIKVVQRIPVRIELDSPPPADHPLRVGASLDVTIDTSDRGGPQLSARRQTGETIPSASSRKQ